MFHTMFVVTPLLGARATAVSHVYRREGATNIQPVIQATSACAMTNLAMTETDKAKGHYIMQHEQPLDE